MCNVNYGVLCKARTVSFLWPRRTTTHLVMRSLLRRTPMIPMKNKVSHLIGKLIWAQSISYFRNMLCLHDSFPLVCLFRADPAKWRHQLELSMLGRHGQWSMWLPIQRGFFLLPLQQGGGEGLRVHRPVPEHARVHAEVPWALSSRGRERGPNLSSLWLCYNRWCHNSWLSCSFWKWLCLFSFKTWDWQHAT